MTQNKFTTNNNPTLVAVSSDDGETPIYLYADPITHGLVINGGSGGGGTQYTEGDDIQTNPIGTLAMFRDDNNFAKPVDNNNPLPVFGNVNATQSGPWTVDTGLTPLTDTELRASPVEVTGTVSTTPPVGGATEAEQEDQTNILEELVSAVKAIAATRGIASDLRVTLLSGTTAVTGTLTGVTTVTTVTGLTNIGGLPAITVPHNIQNQAAIQSNINNVVVS
jgi:hypothetical protein